MDGVNCEVGLYSCLCIGSRESAGPGFIGDVELVDLHKQDDWMTLSGYGGLLRPLMQVAEKYSAEQTET